MYRFLSFCPLFTFSNYFELKVFLFNNNNNNNNNNNDNNDNDE